MGRKVSRKRQTAKRNWLLSRALGLRAKRVCAAALCVTLTMSGSLVNMAAAASEDEEITEFKLTSGMIHDAMEKALVSGKTVNTAELDIEGEYADDYYKLFDGGEIGETVVYELSMPSKFQRKYRKSPVKLQVLMQLDADALREAAELDGDDGEAAEAGYEFNGDEKVIFLLKNDTDEEQEASITVGRRTSGAIVVAPESWINVDGDSDDDGDDVIVIEDEESSARDAVSGPGAVKGSDTPEEEQELSESGVKESGEPQASISLRASNLVMMPLASDSDAGKENGGADGPAAAPDNDEDSDDETLKKATSSDATPSDAEMELLEGDFYDAVLMDGHAVTAFVVSAGDLGINDVNLASSSDALRFYAESENVSVTAWVKKGVIPEEAELKVEELQTEGDTAFEHREAQEALEQAQVAYDDMLACDIYFENDGQRIEPENGSVQVAIEVNRAVLPEDVSADVLAVQHLVEESDGAVRVEQVADTKEGTKGGIEVNDEAAVAEFKVDSFSKFTVTWGTGISTDGQVEFRFINASGDSISYDPTSKYEVKAGTEMKVADYVPYIDGYDYQSAYYTDNGVQVPVAELKAGNQQIRFKTSESGSWKKLNSDEITVMYSGDGPELREGSPETGLNHEKKAEDDDRDGIYDLSLTVSGAVGSETHKQPLDVVFVLDKSGSMGNSIDWFGPTKMSVAKDAIRGLVNSLASNEKLDVRFSLAAFSGDGGGRDKAFNDASIVSEWTNDSYQIMNGLNGIGSNGGTNYQAGLMKASDLLRESRSEAKTAVIFLSDGDPTYYYDTDGFTDGNGSSDDGTALNMARTEVNKLAVNYFFTVGVGQYNSYKKLKGLNEAVQKGIETKFFIGSDQEELNKAFDEIEGSITTLACTNVTITDTLSEYAQIVKNADGKPQQLTVSVINEETGEVKAKGKGSVNWKGSKIKAVYDEREKQIQLQFPSNYELEKGYTYMVTAKIEATEAARGKYQTDKAYPDTGNENTGLHSGKSGFKSNTDAKVTYIYNGEQKEETYPHPVIQLPAGGVKITKQVTGNMGEKKQEFTFNYWMNGNTDSGNPNGTFTLHAGETHSIPNLPAGTKIKIVETDNSRKGYETYVAIGEGQEVYKWEAEVTVDGSETNVVFRNDKTITTPTGLFTNNRPYILMLLAAFAGLGCAAVLWRRKSIRSREDN